MNAMLSDEDLARLLTETGAEVEVPEYDVVLDALTSVPERPRLLARRSVRLAAVAAAVVALGVVALQALPDGSVNDRTQFASAEGSGVPTGGGGATGGTSGALTSLDLPGATTTGTVSGAGGGTAVAGPPVTAPEMALPQPAAALAGPKSAAGAGATVAGTSGQVTAPVGEDDGASRVVKTGTITLVAPDGKVTETVNRVQGFATRAKGYVANAASTEYGDSPSATVTLRVPVSQFEAVVQQVREVGAKVVSAETSGKDVTATYADTEAQIASLKAARSRFLTILSGARTIGETLTVQQRVDDVQARIDRLEGQRRVLANQSSLATLTVTVGEKVELEGKVTSPSGLSTAWSDAKHGFTSGVEGLIARSGRALLVVILGGMLLLVARFGWRLARRRLV